MSNKNITLYKWNRMKKIYISIQLVTNRHWNITVVYKKTNAKNRRFSFVKQMKFLVFSNAEVNESK